MKKFEKVVGYMEEIFLITNSWDTAKQEIERSAALYKKD